MRYILAVLIVALLITLSVAVAQRSDTPTQASVLAGAEAAPTPACCVPCCIVICTPVTAPTLTATPEPTVTQTATPTPTATGTATPANTLMPSAIQTSPKKGVAGGFARDEVELQSLLDQTGATWFYSWILGSNTQWRAGVEFVPMLRTELEMHKSQIRFIINTRGYHGGYWLIGNEPDNSLQDSLTYAQAADKYGQILYYIRSLDPTARFIMPGLVEPKTPWLRQFIAAWVAQWGEEPPVAGWSLHMYPFAKGDETVGQARDRLLLWLSGWIKDHPGKECWVTEFGELGTHDQQTIADTMVRFGNAFEDMPGVTRYAFFWLGSYMERGWDYTSLFVWEDGVPEATGLLPYYQQVPMAEGLRLDTSMGLRLD